MSLIAVGKHIVVKPDAKPKTSPGGVLLPNGCGIEQPLRGEVISVGDSVEVEINEGEIVYFDGGLAFAIGDKLVISYSNILAVENDDDEAELSDLETTDARLTVFKAIEDERNYQDDKWGGPIFDDTQTEEQWASHIREYANGFNRASNYAFRTRMVKVAALAVAAIESYDRKTGV